MNSKAQIIEANGKPEYAVIPYQDYLRLVEAEEDVEDLRAIEEVERKLAAGEEELIPAEMVHRLVEGENAILVWREHRGLTQAQLAKAAGVGQSYIGMIERGKRQGTAAKLRAIARVLKVQVDDLLAWVSEEAGYGGDPDKKAHYDFSKGKRGAVLRQEAPAPRVQAVSDRSPSDAPSSLTAAASGRDRPRSTKRGRR